MHTRRNRGNLAKKGGAARKFIEAKKTAKSKEAAKKQKNKVKKLNKEANDADNRREDFRFSPASSKHTRGRTRD